MARKVYVKVNVDFLPSGQLRRAALSGRTVRCIRSRGCCIAPRQHQRRWAAAGCGIPSWWRDVSGTCSGRRIGGLWRDVRKYENTEHGMTF